MLRARSDGSTITIALSNSRGARAGDGKEIRSTLSCIRFDRVRVFQVSSAVAHRCVDRASIELDSEDPIPALSRSRTNGAPPDTPSTISAKDAQTMCASQPAMWEDEYHNVGKLRTCPRHPLRSAPGDHITSRAGTHSRRVTVRQLSSVRRHFFIAPAGARCWGAFLNTSRVQCLRTL